MTQIVSSIGVPIYGNFVASVVSREYDNGVKIDIVRLRSGNAIVISEHNMAPSHDVGQIEKTIESLVNLESDYLQGEDE